MGELTVGESVVPELDAKGVSGHGCVCDGPCETVVCRVVSGMSCPVRESASCRISS